MKSNRILWFIVFVFVTMTIAISLKTSYSQQNQKQSERKSSPTPSSEQIQDDINQFPVADYSAAEISNAEEREKRKLKGRRYDNSQLVISSNPHPESSGMTVIDESPLPSAIPVIESEVVIIGEILNAEAYLSNNKRSVYSEFTVRVDEVLKNSNNYKIIQNSSITVDRTGGFVRYPNGQKLLYSDAGKELPRNGRRYVLFLTNNDKSLNFNILTGYELRSGKVYPLDISGRFQKFKGMDEINFITTIRESISRPSQKANNQ